MHDGRSLPEGPSRPIDWLDEWDWLRRLGPIPKDDIDRLKAAAKALEEVAAECWELAVSLDHGRGTVARLQRELQKAVEVFGRCGDPCSLAFGGMTLAQLNGASPHDLEAVLLAAEGGLLMRVPNAPLPFAAKLQEIAAYLRYRVEYFKKHNDKMRRGKAGPPEDTRFLRLADRAAQLGIPLKDVIATLQKANAPGIPQGDTEQIARRIYQARQRRR